MKRTFPYGLVLLLASGVTRAVNDDNVIRIGGGDQAGEYINVAQAICGALGRLFSCQPVRTKGTMDNMQRLEQGELEFGLAMDNLVSHWFQDPEISARYTVVRRIDGEAVLVFGKPATIAAVGSWIGVRENASLMDIGLAGELSGDAAVLSTLRHVPDSPLQELAIKTYPNRLQLVEAVRDGLVKLGFIVQIPNPQNVLFTAINDTGLDIIGVVDPDMIALEGAYPIRSAIVKNASWFGIGGKAQQVEAASIPIALVAVKPEVLTGRAVMVQKAAIRQIQAVSGASLLPQSGWGQDIMNATTLTIDTGLDRLLSTMRSAASGAKERIEGLNSN